MPSMLYKQILHEVLNKPTKVKEDFLAEFNRALDSIKNTIDMADNLQNKSPQLEKVRESYQAINSNVQLLLSGKTAVDKLSVSRLMESMEKLIPQTKSLVLKTEVAAKKARNSQEEIRKQLPHFSVAFEQANRSGDLEGDPVLKGVGKYIKNLQDCLKEQNWTPFGDEKNIQKLIKSLDPYFAAVRDHRSVTSARSELERSPAVLRAKQGAVNELDNHLSLAKLKSHPNKSAAQRMLRLIEGVDSKHPDLDFTVKTKSSLFRRKGKQEISGPDKLDAVMQKMEKLEKDIYKSHDAKAIQHLAYSKDALTKIANLFREDLTQALQTKALESKIMKADYRATRNETITKYVDDMNQHLEKAERAIQQVASLRELGYAHESEEHIVFDAGEFDEDVDPAVEADVLAGLDAAVDNTVTQFYLPDNRLGGDLQAGIEGAMQVNDKSMEVDMSEDNSINNNRGPGIQSGA